MADGTWTDLKITFKTQGTKDRPITLCAQTPGKVVLNGESSLQIAGRFLVVEGLHFQSATAGPAVSAVVFRASPMEVASDCRLTQCAIIDYSPANKTVSTNYVTLFGQRNRVDHCYFRGKTNRSATLVVNFDPGAPSNDHRIDHNYFAQRPRLGVNGGETIQIGWSGAQHVNSRTTVEFNYFEDCNGEAEIITNKSCENIYRSNTFVRCLGVLSLRVGDRCTVEGNFFLGQDTPHTGGVHVFGQDHRIINNYFSGLKGSGVRSALSLMSGSNLVTVGDKILAHDPRGVPLHPQVSHALVAFNTFVDCTSPVDIGVAYDRFVKESTLVPTDCIVANNILQGDGTGPIVKYSATPTHILWAGNLAFGGPLGIPPCDGIEVHDPKLVRDATGIWRPAAGSAALGAAAGGYPVLTDIDGQPRPEMGKDIGCDQRSPAPIEHRPLTPRDVGPRWLAAASIESH